MSTFVCTQVLPILVGLILLLSSSAAAPQQVNPPREHESYRSPSASSVQAPVLVSRVEPDYTPEARQKGIEGTVLLRCEVTEEGSTANINVARKLDPGLDANAVEALRQWKFRPGMKDGEPVRVAVSIEMNFRLSRDRR